MRSISTLLRTRITKHLSLRLKFRILSVLKWLSYNNLKSFIPSSGTEKFKNIVENYAKLQPSETIYKDVRVGGNNDGGYVLPRVDKIWDVLISPGVGATSKFELEIANDNTIVLLIDGNVTRPPDLPNNFKFICKLLDTSDTDKTVSLKTLLAEYCEGKQSLLLQMDIEGGEWPILENLVAAELQRFEIIILELHNLENLASESLGKMYSDSLDKLRSTHFPSHFHVNNAGGFFYYGGKRFPRVVEVTFLNSQSYVPTGLKSNKSALDVASDVQIFDWEYKF